MVKLFVSKGANVDAIDNNGNTPLLLLLENEQAPFEIIQLLATKNNVNAKNVRKFDEINVCRLNRKQHYLLHVVVLMLNLLIGYLN